MAGQFQLYTGAWAKRHAMPCPGRAYSAKEQATGTALCAAKGANSGEAIQSNAEMPSDIRNAISSGFSFGFMSVERLP